MAKAENARRNCKGCEERRSNCHATCEIYAEYKRKRDDELAARHAAVELAAFDIERMAEVNKIAKKYRKGKRQ